ncbi:alpha/beta hydrolase family protein [Siansivirga zeaxanthinifaciens]|uniref:Alpha/beta hydrolase n=1 Tax=Siansivirga zeaxanthinifaciens CC-SAMT-1 TaxID=1454006 RepID=A0A0C5WJX6_9FLAO|nr:alpha/beta hydrolase [Siansivirga zeaxanthinifaciens]AJR03050.1 alpha/beta hydrolase [Siansivirga zeaxanthinifaciens CC-SAMT-1]
MITQEQFVIPGLHNKDIIIDVHYSAVGINKPIMVFCHGYKGFKDWGAWNLMAKTFAEAGFYFIKFNFSHNGGTINQPIDFPDLEAFGHNNYIIELDDLKAVIDWIEHNNHIEKTANINDINLIGHSRGGGITLIKAEEDSRVKRVISLASVCEFANRTARIEDPEVWKKNGVAYVVNTRTKQEMPHYYQFYETFLLNETRLDIKRAVSNLKIPHLIIHGNNDTSVSINEAENLHLWNAKSTLEKIDGANHVFGATHPWNDKSLPNHLKEVIKKIIAFLNNN